MANKATIVMWPDCQECMGKNCAFSMFIDLIIDHQGSNYLCLAQGECPYGVERYNNQITGTMKGAFYA